MNPKTLYVAARCFTATMFLMSAVGKVGNWKQSLKLMEEHHMPLAPVGLCGAVTLEIVGGTVLLASGLLMVPLTSILIVYVLAATIAVPVQDIVTDKGRPQGLQLLGSNMAIVGGLVALAACAVTGAFKARQIQ